MTLSTSNTRNYTAAVNKKKTYLGHGTVNRAALSHNLKVIF